LGKKIFFKILTLTPDFVSQSGQPYKINPIAEKILPSFLFWRAALSGAG
jgi:hypothetical protein